ncbi:MAG: hypothetical protein JWR84_2686 [Caulobacter sp.]|nr:hypothetical protein [Caulobacter sp.]
MTLAVPVPRPRLTPDQLLVRTAGVWLAVALVGQWLFLVYIAGFYGPSTLSGDFEAWTRNRMLHNAYRPGDLAGNLTFGGHALLAGVIAFGGALQIMPQVRARWPRFHRWNGRVFLTTAVVLSLTGLGLIWLRAPEPEKISNWAITGNAVLILAFAALAYRTARGRNFVTHRRWALRLYLVSNAQWFMRVGFVVWMMFSRGIGLKGVNGTAFLVWTFGCYLVPLAVLELYLRARAGGGGAVKLTAAWVLGVFTLLMAVGAVIFGFVSISIANGGTI